MYADAFGLLVFGTLLTSTNWNLRFSVKITKTNGGNWPSFCHENKCPQYAEFFVDNRLR